MTTEFSSFLQISQSYTTHTWSPALISQLHHLTSIQAISFGSQLIHFSQCLTFVFCNPLLCHPAVYILLTHFWALQLVSQLTFLPILILPPHAAGLSFIWSWTLFEHTMPAISTLCKINSKLLILAPPHTGFHVLEFLLVLYALTISSCPIDLSYHLHISPFLIFCRLCLEWNSTSFIKSVLQTSVFWEFSLLWTLRAFTVNIIHSVMNHLVSL